jgi:hypothetical protein
MINFVLTYRHVLSSLLLFLPFIALAVEVEMPRVLLDPADERQLVMVACEGPLGVGADRVDAYKYGATVVCSSHGKYVAHPLFAETDCEKKADRWACAPLRYGIRLSSREGSNRIILSGVTPKEALELVRFLDERPPFLGKRIESRQTRDIIQIWRLEDNRFRVHAEFMGHILSIQRNCEQNRCTHSITSFGLIDNF